MTPPPASGDDGAGRKVLSPGELQELLPRFRILGVLGQGGMGVVYRAVQSFLDRPVAIKVLMAHGEDCVTRDSIARFQREAVSLASLSHRGILKVYESGEIAGRPYFVMELVDGPDMSRWIRENGRFDGPKAIQCLMRVCEAVHHAHELGILHRDLKPANILLASNGDPKVADFGLARAHDLDSLNLTLSGVHLGTADFIAPELLRPGGKPDRRSTSIRWA